MKVIVLCMAALWLLLVFPVLYVLRRKCVRQPAIVFPNAKILARIVGKSAKKARVDISAICKDLSILLLIGAYAEPVLVTATAEIICKTPMILASLCCFLLEIFLRNTFFHKIP